MATIICNIRSYSSTVVSSNGARDCYAQVDRCSLASLATTLEIIGPGPAHKILSHPMSQRGCQSLHLVVYERLNAKRIETIKVKNEKK